MSRTAIGIVIEMMQTHFLRTDGHGYNLPKMHGMAKMQEYVFLVWESNELLQWARRGIA